MTNRLRLLSSKAGMKTWVEDNPHDEEHPIIHESQDTTHITDAAKIIRDDMVPGKEWRHAAYIPQFVYNKAAREGWLNDEKAWKKWANDPDNAAFRTWRGRL